MPIKHIYTKPAFVLLVIFLAIALKPLWQSAWIYMSSAVIPYSTTTHTFGGHNNLLVRVGGERWVSWYEKQQATAYHALVVPPQAEFRKDGSISRSDGISKTLTLKWLRMREHGGNSQSAESKSLTIGYDAMTRRVSVGSETYWLSEGNIFVIRLDDEWRPHVTQVEAVLDKAAVSEEVIEFFKRVLPDDEEVKKLY
jgi:hypothetical protein